MSVRSDLFSNLAADALWDSAKLSVVWVGALMMSRLGMTIPWTIAASVVILYVGAFCLVWFQRNREVPQTTEPLGSVKATPVDMSASMTSARSNLSLSDEAAFRRIVSELVKNAHKASCNDQLVKKLADSVRSHLPSGLGELLATTIIEEFSRPYYLASWLYLEGVYYSVMKILLEN